MPLDSGILSRSSKLDGHSAIVTSVSAASTVKPDHVIVGTGIGFAEGSGLGKNVGNGIGSIAGSAMVEEDVGLYVGS